MHLLQLSQPFGSPAGGIGVRSGERTERTVVLASARGPAYHHRMGSLAEIEKAAEALSPKEKEQLIFFLAARLRGQGVRMPPPRTLSREQVDAWIAEDEADLRALKREG